MDDNWFFSGPSLNTNKLIIGGLNSHPLGTLLLASHANGHVVVVVDCQTTALGADYPSIGAVVAKKLKGSEIMLESGPSGLGFNPFWFVTGTDYLTGRRPANQELLNLAGLLEQLGELPGAGKGTTAGPLVEVLRAYYATEYATAGPSFSSFYAFLQQGRTPTVDDGWLGGFLENTGRYTGSGRLAYLLNALPQQLRFLYEVKNKVVLNL